MLFKINNDLLERYHIGSLIFDTVNINPQTYLHFGVWELWGQGRMPIGIDEADEDFDASGKIGGEKTHTLTIKEIPSHSHKQSTLTYADTTSDRYFGNDGGGTWMNNRSNLYTDSTGGGAPHNNLPPYIVCYIWKRIS